jgi:hypothetical protein
MKIIIIVTAGLVAMLSVAAAADLPRKEPPPVAAAPIGKYIARFVTASTPARPGSQCRRRILPVVRYAAGGGGGGFGGLRGGGFGGFRGSMGCSVLIR